MKGPTTLLLLALMLAPCICAEGCSGELSMSVPAVIGSGGGLVNTTMRSMPGDGSVFIGSSPYTSTDTQRSVEDAVGFARALSGPDAPDCDILLTFDIEDAGGYIEGPSAGTAISVLAYSLMQGIAPRQDAIVTGTIDRDGRMGEVGGLYEKAKAAALDGKEYFITPPATFYEMLVLNRVEEEYGITVLESEDAEEVLRFMLFNESINQTDFTAEELEAPDVPQYDAEGLERFVPVSQDMLDMLEAEIGRLDPSDSESLEIKKFFEGRLRVGGEILDKGYVFTAANSAFLDYIDLSTVNAILEDGVDIRAKAGGVHGCLDAIERPLSTDENFEWVAGSAMREAWAAETLSRMEGQDPLLAEEEYSVYHELMYAEAWCSVSRSLAVAAGEEGEPIDESAWKGIADEMLNAAGKTEHSEDTERRLGIAEESYDNGDYGAAIYDLVYVVEMDTSDSELESFSDEELLEEVEALAGQERTSLWGRIYQTQGVFLAREGNGAGSAYRILRLASGLDSATAAMRTELESREQDGRASEARDTLVLFLQVSIFIIFVVLLAYITMRKDGKGRFDGRDNHKGYRSPPGSRKKEG